MKPAALVLLAGLAACSGPAARRESSTGVMSGLDVLVADGFRPLKGKRVGVLTNSTAIDRRGRSIVDLLASAPGVTLAAIFTPEHGYAAASESESIVSGRTRVNGREIPLYSLYSGGIKGMRPKPEQLQGLDVLVFDIQDIGARFYTYLATMAMALEEAKDANVDFVVLDRPNPIRGDIVEGPVLADPSLRFLTPTAYFQIPVRHGLTAGEIALLHNQSVGHPHLSVVKLRGWRRSMWFEDTGLPWVPPSPNMPVVEAAALYPGIGIFEASNLAVGRGTPLPFRWIGAPWMKADEIVSRLQGTVEGVEFSVQDYTPTKSVFEGQLCHGVRITVTDRDAVRPTSVFLHLALALREVHPKELEWRWDEVKRMVGVDEFRLMWETGAGQEAFLSLFDKGPRDFEPRRRSVLLY
jgi:uncharacterized protein YbbC (DUF1343 family)